MIPLYTDRLSMIREMLLSPMQEMVEEAHGLLFNLWLEYRDDSDFCAKLKDISKSHPGLVQEFFNQIDKLPHTKKDKSVLLRKSSKLLIPASKKDNVEKSKMITPKIFISYAHKDEPFKDEFVTMFAGLQRRGVISAWQDRLIEAGEEWFDAIRNAMNECNMAVLLVSSDFIASSFIQEKELRRLFQRRLKGGLRVLPIIIRPCLWQEEPVIKDIQVLPKDGKPVISFSKENGDRDQVWADIGKKIKEIAENL